MTTVEEVAAALGGPLPDGPTDPAAVVDQLVAAATPGLAALDSGRFFGFVIGGALPAARAADWLALAWDQNAGLATVTPAATAAEQVASGWLLDLLGLPASASVGFVTGGSMANTTCLLAARHAVLERAGWDVEQRGLQGAPRVHVVVPEERHATVDVSLRYVGLGVGTARRVACDDQGRMLLDDLDAALAEVGRRPVHRHRPGGQREHGQLRRPRPGGRAGAPGRRLGARGRRLRAVGRRVPRFAHLVDGHAGADSWATDAHKWLNVPYDSGLAIVADPVAHRAALGVAAAYLIKVDGPTDPMDLVPEFSRRARGFAVWAALRSLGRSGVADLVERLCDRAGRFAAGMRDTPGAEVLNEVVLNQVLTRFDGSDDVTRAVVDGVLADGTVYLSPTVFRGQAGVRCSVSNWATTDADVDAAVAAVRRALTTARS